MSVNTFPMHLIGISSDVRGTISIYRPMSSQFVSEFRICLALWNLPITRLTGANND